MTMLALAPCFTSAHKATGDAIATVFLPIAATSNTEALHGKCCEEEHSEQLPVATLRFRTKSGASGPYVSIDLVREQ